MFLLPQFRPHTSSFLLAGGAPCLPALSTPHLRLLARPRLLVQRCADFCRGRTRGVGILLPFLLQLLGISVFLYGSIHWTATQPLVYSTSAHAVGGCRFTLPFCPFRRYPVAQRPTVLQLLALQGLISIQRACSTEPHRALDELHAAIGPSHLKGLFAGLGSISASAFPTSCSSAPSPSPPALSPCPYGREEHQGEHLGRNSPDGGKALVAPCGSATRAHPPDAASDSVLEALSEVWAIPKALHLVV